MKMKLHRFIGNFDFNNRRLRVGDLNLVSQLKNTLRLVPGDKVILGDGQSKEALAEIIEYYKNGVELELLEVKDNQNEPSKEAILYCSILKKENFELVVQKATEIGIKRIVPLITARTVKLNLKTDRLEKIVKEAAEQSGRGMLPVVSEPMIFSEVLNDVRGNAINLFFHPEGSGFDRKELLARQKIGIFIGPEGGWTDEEVSMGRAANCEVVTLGRLTFRAETAAIIASYLALMK